LQSIAEKLPRLNEAVAGRVDLTDSQARSIIEKRRRLSGVDYDATSCKCR
jgi:hypothetical protein